MTSPNPSAAASFVTELRRVPNYNTEFTKQKYSISFYGASVNVTALPYRPYWTEAEVEQDSSSSTRYSGSDAKLLITIAEALNFTFIVLPVTSWDQVTSLVVDRISFMATVLHAVLPQRQLIYDFTYIYEHDPACFVMAKPSLRSNWQSLYEPLTDEVWASVLASVLLVPLLLFLITRPQRGEEYGRGMSLGDAAEIAVGSLLGQGTSKHLPTSNSTRLLLTTWLLFTLVVGTVYRGNLTAYLTMPKYPPRPETLDQLATTAQK
nr:glutamate receptor ionotropic, delta-1-like [Procambarus clarkii]